MADDLSDQDPSDDLSFVDLENGGIYEVYSRNLLRGVYREEDRVIIGIREKFGATYLFAELVNDPPGRGTVSRILKKLGTVPGTLDRTILSEKSQYLRDILNGYDPWELSKPCRTCGVVPHRNGWCGVCRKQVI